MVDTPTRSDGQVHPAADAEDEAVARVEAYDDEDGVVLYDAQNPLAWMKASNAVVLGDRL